MHYVWVINSLIKLSGLCVVGGGNVPTVAPPVTPTLAPTNPTVPTNPVVPTYPVGPVTTTTTTTTTSAPAPTPPSDGTGDDTTSAISSSQGWYL